MATATSNNIARAGIAVAPYHGPGCKQGAGGNTGPAGAVELPDSDRGGVVVNALDSCTLGPTAAAGPTNVSTMMDGEGDDDGLPNSNGLHDANNVVPMRTRAVNSHAAKSSLLAYFQRVNWPLNNVLPRGKAFFGGEIGNIVKEFGLSKAQVSRQLLNYKRESGLDFSRWPSLFVHLIWMGGFIRKCCYLWTPLLLRH